MRGFPAAESRKAQAMTVAMQHSCACQLGSPARSGAVAWSTHARAVLRSPLFVFLAAVAAAFVIFFARSPGAWVTPLFFAEDRDWTSLIVTRGFWHTVFHARSDYCIFGNALVLWIGMRLCDLVDGGDPLNLPRWQAIASYLTYAVIVSLPVPLLRGRLAPAGRLAVWLLAVFMPLGIHADSWSGFEILGRACNVGFAFLFVGFVLVWTRHRATSHWWTFVAIDLGLLACALTNPMCMVFLPAAAWPLLYRVWDAGGGQRRIAVLRLIGEPGTWSLTVLVIAATLGLGIPAATDGVACADSTPLNGDRMVEFGIARSLFSSVSWPVYRWLTTDRTLALAGITLWLTWRYGLRRHRLLYAGGLSVLAISSLILVVCRPDVGRMLADYRSTFPDRYFYAQYLVGLPLMAAFASDVGIRLARRPWLAPLPMATLYILAALAACREPPWTVSSTQFMVDDNGCLARAASRAVASRAFRDADGAPAPEGQFIGVMGHPAFPREVLLPRDAVERAVAARFVRGAIRSQADDGPRRRSPVDVVAPAVSTVP